jgi:hypothetical protein
MKRKTKNTTHFLEVVERIAGTIALWKVKSGTVEKNISVFSVMYDVIADIERYGIEYTYRGNNDRAVSINRELLANAVKELHRVTQPTTNELIAKLLRYGLSQMETDLACSGAGVW